MNTVELSGNSSKKIAAAAAATVRETRGKFWGPLNRGGGEEQLNSSGTLPAMEHNAHFFGKVVLKTRIYSKPPLDEKAEGGHAGCVTF